MIQKILILGQPRSGTSSLLDGISLQNYLRISEPFNPNLVDRGYKYPLKQLETHDRVVVKLISLQEHIPIESKDIVEFYLNFSNLFDKIILLKRNNSKEHFESLLNLYWHLKRKKESPTLNFPSSHKKYMFNDTLKYDSSLVNSVKIDQKETEDNINKISEKLNIQSTSYEDLYGEDRNKSFEIIKNWDLDLDPFGLNEYLHPKNRYRQFKNKHLI